MTETSLAGQKALRLVGILVALAAPCGFASAQGMLTMPAPAQRSAPESAPVPAASQAAPAAPEAPAPATGSLFSAPTAPPAMSAPAAPSGSLFGAPTAPSGSSASPGPSPMFSGPPGGGVAAAPPPSMCETEMQKFQTRRMSHIDQLNAIVKNSKDGKVDPTASCPKLRQLASVEGDMRGWMTKQQKPCSIPDEVMKQMREATAKTAQIADRACQAAAEMKRQQTGGGGPAAPAVKLPAGPL